jgi:(p)ppGpp synthase/HD superfamily hydrolase
MDNFDELYEKACRLAENAHYSQKRWNGDPYITHPRRVAEKLEGIAKIVAMLHDTIEDTKVTYNDLFEIFGKEIADAVLSVSRLEGETYTAFIERTKQNPIGVQVKIADIKDNMSDLRKDHNLMRRYVKALKELEGIENE